MKVDFKRLTWENYPSTETPINADNLNRLEEGVAGLYSDMAEIEESVDSLETFKDETSTQVGSMQTRVTSMENGLPAMVGNQIDTKFGNDIGDNVTTWLTEHVTPSGSAVVVDDTLTIAGAAADAKKTGDEISGLKGSIENLDDGKLKIAPTFVFGTLDTNGDIIPFANNSRCSSVEYYTAKNGDVLTLDAGFSMILCEYNASQTLESRAVKTSGTYALTEGNLYRVCVFDPNGTIQNTPYDYAFKAYIPSEISKKFNAIDTAVENVTSKMSEITGNLLITPVDNDSVYHNDGYVNASTNAITSIGTSAQYFYSDLIPLYKGDVVTVNYRDTLDVVWILSQWTSAGVFVSGILKGNDVSDTVQTYQFTASEDMYIRHSARFLNSLSIKKINAENADMLADYLSSENDTDYGFLLNSFLKIGGIGDSLASGECISGTQGGVTVANDLYEHSWLQYMARFYGFTGINFSKGGMTARGWLFDDDYNQQGWTKAQIADNKCNAYIIGLGANDMALMIEDASYLGSPSDIDTTNPTFYRYYSQIISRLKTIQPKAKFFLFTLTWLYTETPPYSAWVERVNEAIRYIGEHNDNCYVIDLDADRWYYGSDVTGNRRSGHYNAIGYNMQAMHLAKLIGKYIHDHQSEFRQVEFIGTDLSWN